MNDVPWADLALNLAASAAAVTVFLGLIMAVATAIKDQSIIDIFWGPGFVVVALTSYLMSAGEGDGTRRLVVLVLTAVWGLRLGLHIGRRNLGHGEDPRYTALMKKRQGNLAVYLVRHIYGLQGVLMLVVSVPVQAAMYQDTGLEVFAFIGIALWVTGFLFEAVGDWQLSRFKAGPANAGTVLDTGLWAWTRHPNYFGDAVVWFGLLFLALGQWWGLATIVGPIIMTRLLLSYSGKALLERRMKRSKGEAYERYLATTSGFFPRPPKRGGADEKQPEAAER